MKIGSFNTDEKVLIIAEVGNNHEGDFALARDMIALAAEAGAGAVKFQTIVPEKLVSVLQADRIKQLRKFQFSYEQFAELKSTADRAGIMFLSTPFDLESVAALDSLAPAFKIASGDNNFFPLLRAVAATGKPIILSAGMTSLEEIRDARAAIEQVWTTMHRAGQLAILHCVVSYPTMAADANLSFISELRKEPGITVGYSDHTIGNAAAVLAVALGARIIEKHFTINKNHSEFRDHKLSADPQDLRQLVEQVAEAELLLGSGPKRVLECEQGFRVAARRSIVAVRELSAGTKIADADLGWVRPGGGQAPGTEEALRGRVLKRTIQAGEQILMQDVE